MIIILSKFKRRLQAPKSYPKSIGFELSLQTVGSRGRCSLQATKKTFDARLGLTYASVSLINKFVIRRTLAAVLSLCIHTCAVLARLRIFALVDVGAIATGRVEFVAVVAFAAKHAEDVLALAVDAEVAEHLALVDVDAGLLVVVHRHETHLALAAKRARVVQAMAVFTETRVVGTLVDVLAGVAVAAKSRIANALKDPKMDMV